MHSYEIEIKSLLGTQEAADGLRARMLEIDPNTLQTSSNTQLNHYFVGDDLNALYDAVSALFSAEEQLRLKKIIEEGSSFSIRTREVDGKVLLVIKASIDDSTSANGVSRIEFESPVTLSLAELDQKLLDAGCSYQAKWSRAREEYTCKGATVCLDRNAGYGYLAEFERVVDDESQVDAIRASLYALMEELGVSELPQDRLERMFAHYNEHWPEYYGTEKIFVIE